MAVSNFHGTNPLVSHSPFAADLQQFRGFENVEHFDEQDLFVQDSRVTQVRSRTFIRFLEQNLKSQEKSKPALGILLRQVLQLSDSKEDRQRLGAISQAFFKQSGYFSRLFSGEFWEEWTEHRTALGKVDSHLSDCMVSSAQVENFTKGLDEEVVQKANKEAEVLLKSLNYRNAARGSSFSIESMSSCVIGLVGGTLGSLITQHPLPLLLGLSQCFPKAQAQQKVGNEFQVNTYTTGNQHFSSVESLKDGNFVVTWDGAGQGEGWGVFGQLSDGNGSKIGSEFQVNTYTTGNQHFSSAESLKDGNFVVTWDGAGQGEGWGVFGQLFNANGSRVGSEFQVNTYTANDQKLPSVASLNNGNFVVSWESHGQDYGSGVGVFGQLFDESGSKVGSEFQVNNYTQNHQGNPSVTGLDTGNFVVTWYSKFQDGSTVSAFGQLFNESGNKIRSEFRINTFINGSQGRPSVANLKNNHFIVTWRSLDQDGSLDGVYGQLFDENCSKIGNEFQINTYTDLEQDRPSVASLQNDNFIVTWQSNGQDGSGYGVYGQIFRDNFTLSSSSSSTSTSQTTTTTTLPFVTTIPVTSNPFSSSANRVPTETSVLTSDSVSKIVSPSSNRNNGLFWLWLLLGGAGGITCMGLTAYYFSKKRKEETSMPEQAELGTVEMPPIDASRTDSLGDSEYKKLGDIKEESSDRNYGNRPKKARLDSEYANRPKREKRSSEYANRPRRADRDSLYANVPDAEDESSEMDIVTGEY